MQTVFLSFLILLFSNIALGASPHETIQNRDEITLSESRMIGDVTVHFYLRNESDLESLYLTLTNSFAILPQYLRNTNRCKNLELSIYEISRSTLNDRSTMSFLNWRSWNNKDIFGTYDSIRSEPGSASIFLTRDRGLTTMRDTLVHEVAHYWQDTRCIPVVEPVAYGFEEYYKATFD